MLACEVSYGNQDYMSNWEIAHLCEVLFKMTSFCLCPENFNELEIKDNGILSL